MPHRQHVFVLLAASKKRLLSYKQRSLIFGDEETKLSCVQGAAQGS